jgi:hypothetical protein
MTLEVLAESHNVQLVAMTGGFDRVVRAYTAEPAAFRLQFGRAADDVETVIRSHEALAAAGVQSFLAVHYRRGAGWDLLAHMRIEWRLMQDGVVGLHGGHQSPLPEHAAFRREAFGLSILSALANPAVDGVATSALASNLRAQKFIERCGFRRVRLQNTPVPADALVHYRLVRPWMAEVPWLQLLAATSAITPLRPVPYSAARPPEPSGPGERPAAAGALVPVPAGWFELRAEDSEPFFAQMLSTPQGWRHVLDLRGADGITPATLASGLAFEAKHGVVALAAEVGGAPTGLMFLRGEVRADGRLAIRGGPIAGATSLAPSLQAWTRRLHQLGVARMEAIVSHQGAVAFWQASGFSLEGVAEVDRDGEPVLFALSSVASTHSATVDVADAAISRN